MIWEDLVAWKLRDSRKPFTLELGNFPDLHSPTSKRMILLIFAPQVRSNRSTLLAFVSDQPSTFPSFLIKYSTTTYMKLQQIFLFRGFEERGICPKYASLEDALDFFLSDYRCQAQPVDATPSNRLIRRYFPRRTDLSGSTRSKPSQGNVSG